MSANHRSMAESPVRFGAQMKVLAMKACLNALLLGALLGVPSALSAQLCETDCANTCTSSSYCGTGCTLSCDTPSTCGEYGVCNPDPDGDGVISNDNCPFTYNPDQADCDGDGTGNVCDSDNGSWSLVSGTDHVCVIIGRTHFGYVDVQEHVEGLYHDVSSCGSPDKWKDFALPGASCYGFITVEHCCDITYGSNLCAAHLNNSSCHT
jgi:hypothetical protein